MERSIPLQKTTQVLAQQLDDSVVILNPESGEYFTLNEVGARIWELIDGHRTQDDIVGLICAEYEADEPQVRSDVETLLADLRAEKLIDGAPSG